MERLKELAEQISEVYDRLQRLVMPVTPDNAEIMSGVYGMLRYVYQELTETETEAEAGAGGAEEEANG